MISATLPTVRSREPLLRADSPGQVLACLKTPVVGAYFVFLVLMAAMSFDLPGVSRLAFLVRWPLLGAAAALGLALTLRGGRPLPAAFKVLVVFLGCVAVSALYSFDPMYSAKRWISLVLLFGGTSLALWQVATSPQRLIAFTDMLWLLGTALVLAGFVYRGGGDGDERFAGIYARATAAGTYAALFLPLAVYQARYRFHGMWQAFAWGVVLLFVLQPLMASARTALAISLAVAVVLAFDYFGAKAAVAFAALALLVPLPLMMNAKAVGKLQDKAEQVLRPDSIGTLTGRTDRWAYGLEKFAERPLTGFGFGASRHLPGIEAPRRFGVPAGAVVALHSDQVELLMDLGIFGAGAFMLFWLLVVAAGVRTAVSADGPLRPLALAYCGSVAYCFVDTFMHGAFVAAGSGTAAFTWSFVALSLVACRMASLQPATRSARPQPTVPERAAASRRRPAVADLPSVRNVLTG